MPALAEIGPQDELVDQIAAFRFDPLGHAIFCYPWGEGVLAGVKGPRAWQADVMEDIREQQHVTSRSALPAPPVTASANPRLSPCCASGGSIPATTRASC